MQLSQNGINFIKRYEGLRLEAYKPVSTEMHYTIGFGHYGPDVQKGAVITKEQAENLLKRDLERFVNAVNKLVTVEINQNQFDALVSFTYNCGIGALQKSTLLELVNRKEFITAAKEFDKWTKAGGNVLAGLVKRRAEEKELFLAPIQQKEVVKLYNPESKALKDATENVLKTMINAPVKPISSTWLDKLQKGELTESQATGLLFAAIERGLLK